MQSPDPIIPIAGRTCGACAMCCKLGAIAEVQKAEGQWCQHCSTRKGCDIYASRPDVCRSYYCFFMLSDLPEEWRPSTAKFMVSLLQDNVVNIAVDSARPDAWKKEPYFSRIRHWSKDTWVVVLIDRHALAVYPDRIDDLGLLDEEHMLAHFNDPTPTGPVKRTRKIHKKDIPAGMGN